ncbi:MAG: DMT family transporter [Acidimicrobiia bacterium]
MQARVLSALIAASLGWGMAGVGTRYLFGEGVATFTVVVVRTLTATAAVLVVGLASGTRVDRTAWRDGSIIGVLRIGIAPILFISSLQYVSAGVEGIFITLIPATTATLAAVFLHEHLDRNQVAGLVIGLLGTLLIVASGDSGIGGDGGDVRIGAMFALCGVVAGASSGVLSRKYAPRHRTTDLAVPMFVSGSVIAVVGGLVTNGIEFSAVTATSWVTLIALGLGSTFLPFFATLFASSHTTAARVALTGYLAPVVGVVAGVVLLGEVLTAPIVVGATLALVGIVIVGRGRRVRRPAKAVG